jgi:hypothetical protein
MRSIPAGPPACKTLPGGFDPGDTSWEAILAHAVEVGRWLQDLRRRAAAKSPEAA